MNNRNNIQALAEGAILIALSVVLSMIAIFKMPMGGTVAPFAMAPLVIFALRRGAGWGVGAGLTYGIVQALLGLENFSYVIGIAAIVGVALLDYLIAFGAYGLAPIIAKPFSKNKVLGYGIAAFVCGALQFLCSFISGIIIWGGWAPEDTPVWLYSLTYNGSYALPNAILTVIGTVAVMTLLDKVFPVKNNRKDGGIEV
ncbi:MAG: energy-coupled thiamine transporter ThiT [Oscillospiraceae bacterium]|jgi:thiamine transporter|nr:energy-coupled thiamine transporter ThiT [Oscillospiraceae bacterium]